MHVPVVPSPTPTPAPDAGPPDAAGPSDEQGSADAVDQRAASPTASTRRDSVAQRRAAIRDVYLADRDRLVGFAVLVSGCEATAQDAVHEAFLKLDAHWPRVRRQRDPLPWLRTTVLNVIRARARRERRSWRARAVAPGVEESAEVLAALTQERQRVIEALGTLSARQREVVVLRYWQECSEAEIARTLGISAGSVKTHASRALAALRAALEEE